VVSVERGYLSVGSARTYIGAANQCRMRIFVDKRSVEVYVNDGTAAVYNWVEAAHEDQGLAVFAKANAFGGRGGGPTPQQQAGPAGGRAGGPAPQQQAGQAGRGGAAVQLASLKVWPMKPAAFSLEHFKI
jgi:hypothetical protein